MMYIAFPALIAAMLFYMFWHAGFRMRRQRLASERALRGRRFALPRIRRPARR